MGHAIIKTMPTKLPVELAIKHMPAGKPYLGKAYKAYYLVVAVIPGLDTDVALTAAMPTLAEAEGAFAHIAKGITT